MSFSIKGFPFFAGFVAFLGTLASAATINVDIGKEYSASAALGLPRHGPVPSPTRMPPSFGTPPVAPGLRCTASVSPRTAPHLKRVSPKKQVNTESKSGQPRGHPDTP